MWFGDFDSSVLLLVVTFFTLVPRLDEHISLFLISGPSLTISPGLKTDAGAQDRFQAARTSRRKVLPSLYCTNISLATQVVFSLALGDEDRDFYFFFKSFSLAFSSLGQLWRINSKVNMGRLHPLPGGNISAST